MKKLMRILFILLLTFIAGKTFAGSGANSTLQNIQPGTWFEIPKNVVNEKGEKIDIPCGITGYSGMAYDSKNHQVLAFDGGNNDYWGNEIFALDTETLIWNRMYKPNPPEDYNYGNINTDSNGDIMDYMLRNTGLAMSTHTYENVKFKEHAGVMVVRRQRILDHERPAIRETFSSSGL